MGERAVKRISVTFPISVLEELRRYVPRRERSRFIVEATERELRRRRLTRALRESAGAWSDEDHPDLMTVEDIDRYVRRLRETWMPRSWDEIIAEAKKDE
ncbi:MAG TPA: hypothetical protein ENK56_07065 [Chloroflexi bacterium]|nr:hypothetical protein [Chloroflexota bacterium]